MSDDEGDREVGGRPMASGFTPQMTDALLALRRGSMRMDVHGSADAEWNLDTDRGGVPGARRSPEPSNSDLGQLSGRRLYDISVDTVSSAPISSVSSQSSMFWRNSMYGSATQRHGIFTSGCVGPVSSVTESRHNMPISSVLDTHESSSHATVSRNEVEELRAKVRDQAYLLERYQTGSVVTMGSAGDADRLRWTRSATSDDTPTLTRRPGGPTTTSATATTEVRDYQYGTKPYHSNVKLGIYRGDTSLETFLAKFENCSKYLKWSADDRLFHLGNSLESAAGQVLWDATACNSAETLIQLLRHRFGNQNQTERFRAELKTRRRRQGETLQQLYQDICRLMSLAYPGQSNELSDCIAKDSFLDALDDPKLRREILIQQPQNLDAALAVASRMEAYDKESHEQSDVEQGRGRWRNRHVRKINNTGGTNSVTPESSHLSKRMEQLESKLEAFMNQFQNQASARSWPAGHVDPIVPGGPLIQPSVEYRPTSRTAGQQPASDFAATNRPYEYHSVNQRQANRRYIPRDTCRNCLEKGHWAKFCPKLSAEPATNAGANNSTGDASRLNVVNGGNDKSSKAVYLKIRVNGHHVNCLLDSGCEQSIVNSHLIEGLQLEPVNQQLFAANGTAVPVKGAVYLRLTIHGVSTELRALATDAVEDLILGADWLTDQSVHWDFGNSVITLKGKRIPLSARSPQNMVRRIYVSESTIIAPGHMSDIPVMATLRDLRVPKTEWATDARPLQKDVIAARTLLPSVKLQSAIRVINMGNKSYELKAGQFVGNAVPVEVTETSVENDVGSRCTVTSADATMGIPEHVTCLLESLPSDLSSAEREAVASFIRVNADVFSKSEFDIGRTHLVRHQIDTGNHPPIKQALRRHPMAYWPIIDQHVEEMLANDIIEPAASPWASNVVLIRKKDGKMRFCVDYRRLNDVSRKDSYPLPRIEDCLSVLGGACYFSTLDLRAGYWQTAMDERDADKTAFVTRRGVFRFKVLSFGLANAPSLFQRLMEYVLAGLTWEACLVYIDDIIIWAESFPHHLQRLSQVFQRLRDANLKLKPSKCRLFQRKVTFLGHVISAAGIEPDPDKISSVQEWPTPRCVTDIRAFLGLASYYRRHVKGFADIARPLHELTRKNEPFQWNQRRQEAFEQLQRCLVTAPILSAPLDNGQYVLDTDASDIGLGAVLQQEQPDGLRVIAYASRVLSKAESSYCTTKKELLAVTYGLKVFRQYLLARDFILRTDHAALTHLRRTPEPVGQQARWLDLLAEFNFTIQHRPGEASKNADGLSRRVCDENCRHCHRKSHVKSVRSVVGAETQISENADESSVGEEVAESDQVLLICATEATEPLADADLFAPVALRQAQANDETISPVVNWLRAGAGRPEWKQLETLSEDTRTLWGQFESLQLKDGVLYRQFFKVDGSVDHLQVVLPRTLRSQFMKLVHEGAGGHFALKRTQEQVQRRAYWPAWRRSVAQFISRCLPCAQFQQSSKPVRQGALQSFEANGPADRYCVDLVGPYPRTRKGRKYILTAIDAYTRYLTCVALPEKTAINVANALIEGVFFKLGCPRSLLSDLGTDFNNQVLEHLSSVLGIQKLRTTVHRPSANGRCERSHRTISACLAKLVAVNQTDWDEKLQLVTFAMNCARSEATSFSPFELMYGRLPRMPADLLLDLPAESQPSDVNEYVEQFNERLRESHKLVQQQMHTTFSRMKRNYDAKVKDSSYAVGQYVLFFYPRRYKGRNPKLARPNIGPFKILRRLNAVNFIIAMTPRSRQMIVHIDKLKPWHGDEPKCWVGVKIQPPGHPDGELSQQPDSNKTQDGTEIDVPSLEGVFDANVEDEETVHDLEPVSPVVTEASPKASASKSTSISPSAVQGRQGSHNSDLSVNEPHQYKATPRTRADGRPVRPSRLPVRYRL